MLIKFLKCQKKYFKIKCYTEDHALPKLVMLKKEFIRTPRGEEIQARTSMGAT